MWEIRNFWLWFWLYKSGDTGWREPGSHSAFGPTTKTLSICSARRLNSCMARWSELHRLYNLLPSRFQEWEAWCALLPLLLQHTPSLPWAHNFPWIPVIPGPTSRCISLPDSHSLMDTLSFSPLWTIFLRWFIMFPCEAPIHHWDHWPSNSPRFTAPQAPCWHHLWSRLPVYILGLAGFLQGIWHYMLSHVGISSV